MTTAPAAMHPAGSRYRTAIWLTVGALLLLVIGANAHLVYVAVTSQPGCVAHRGPGEKPGESGGNRASFSAAESACSPASGTSE